MANITDNCILGLDYLKARKAVIDLGQGVFNDTIVKGKYKYAEGTPVWTHKVRLVNDCHLFPNSVSRATVRGYKQTTFIRWWFRRGRIELI